MTDQPLGRRTQMDALAFAKQLEPYDILVTDPPWDLEGSGRFEKAAPYALMKPKDLEPVLRALHDACKPNRHAYVFAPSAEYFPAALAACLDAGWHFHRLLAWDKTRFSSYGLGGTWRNAFEPVFLLSKGKPRKRLGAGAWPSLLAQRQHHTRTAKPPSVYKTFLEASTLPGELAVDPFCGMDPLAEAARSLGDRRWISNDVLSPDEVDAQAARRRGAGPVRNGSRGTPR